jgi:hypothetical protein
MLYSLDQITSFLSYDRSLLVSVSGYNCGAKLWQAWSSRTLLYYESNGVQVSSSSDAYIFMEKKDH